MKMSDINPGETMKQFLHLKIFMLLLIALLTQPVWAEGYGDDRAEIENLQARYLLAMDFLDADAYAEVFTEDGVMDWAGGVITGREAIRAFMASGRYNPARGAAEADWPAASRHFIMNQVIKVDGNKASAITYWFQANNNADRGTMTLGMFGNYVDELEKVNGEWLFTRRAIYNEGIPNRNKAGTKNPDPFRQ
ncbi:MAG: hypothetical protein ACI934_000219 [Pseudohongiellaceae bacterium]|jgi:hypothetical protein